MKIIGAMLVRNETNRYLEKVLRQMWRICDQIVVIDDGSDDETPYFCEELGCKVAHKETSLWGIDELTRRKELWALATRDATAEDWILCLDADEYLEGIELLKEELPFVSRETCVDGIGFNLYDMWDETHYRADTWWNAHQRLWALMIKYDPNRKYIWREQPLHCGRFPLNANYYVCPSKAQILHYGWANEFDRQVKYERYMTCDPHGKCGVLAQYESILEPNPTLLEANFIDANPNRESC